MAEAYHVGYDDLRKLVHRMAIQTGLAKPVSRPRQTQNRNKDKVDGNIRSQRILLTWLIEDEHIFRQICRYITPEDFTGDLYRTVASLLYEQYENQDVNPARLMNHFTDEEEHREVASLFHTKIRELTTEGEQEKALKETLIRVKNHSIEQAARELDATDIKGMQRLMAAKREWQDLEKLHISVN